MRARHVARGWLRRRLLLLLLLLLLLPPLLCCPLSTAAGAAACSGQSEQSGQASSPSAVKCNPHTLRMAGVCRVARVLSVATAASQRSPRPASSHRAGRGCRLDCVCVCAGLRLFRRHGGLRARHPRSSCRGAVLARRCSSRACAHAPRQWCISSAAEVTTLRRKLDAILSVRRAVSFFSSGQAQGEVTRQYNSQ